MRIEFNQSAFRELRTSAGTKAKVKELADEIEVRANASSSTTEPAATEPYYQVEDHTDAERARYRVYPTSERAIRHEAKTQALQKAL